jgi:copper homeostasis protein CutC
VILTASGGARTAWDGRENLKSLMEVTGPRMSILPGSGINANNLPDLLRELPRLTEVHLTASEAVAVDQYEPEEGYEELDGPLEETLTKFGFGSNQVWTMNEGKIRAVFKVIDDVGKIPLE